MVGRCTFGTVIIGKGKGKRAERDKMNSGISADTLWGSRQRNVDVKFKHILL